MMTVHTSSGSSNQQGCLRTRGARIHACHRAGLLRRVGGFAALLTLSGGLPIGAQTIDWHAREALVADHLGTPADTGTRLQRQVIGGMLGSNWVQRDKLVTPFGPQDNEFGEVVAVDGDTALVLSCSSPDGTSFHVYARSGDLWSEQAILTPYPDESVCGFFFPGQIALDGDTAAFSSLMPFDFEQCRAGEVVIYSRTGTQWIQQAVLSPSQPFEAFNPYGLTLDGNTLVRVGVLGDDSDPECSTIESYQAVVSVRSGDDWVEQARLSPPSGGTFISDPGGIAAVAGDTLAIVGETAAQERVVYVWARDGDAWSFESALMPSDGAPDTRFGYSIDVDGDTIVVGAPRQGGKPPLPLGKVYVYTRDGETWSEQAQLTAPVSDGEDGNFARRLSLDGDVFLVGARGIGSAFVFNRSGESWDVAATLTPADEAAFAHDVALSGDTAIIGTNDARIFDPDPSVPGWAYLFDTRPPAPALGLDPGALDFGEIPVGQSSDVQVVDLENNGSADLQVGMLGFGGEHPGDFEWVENPCSEQTIAPGEVCTVAARFSPTAVGDRTGTLDVPSNAPTTPDSALLAGEGLVGPPTMRLDRERVAAVVAEGGTTEEPLTVSNIGTLDLSWEILDQGVANLGLLRPRRPATVFDTSVDRATDDHTRLTTASGDRKIFRPESSGGVGVMGQGITVTHSQSTDIVVPNTPKCGWKGTSFTTPNQFLRTFTLTDFGITDDFEVTEVSFGIESLDAEVDITVNLYTLDGPLFIYENLGLLASQEVALAPQTGTIVSVPISATVPNGATLVMEIAAPDMLDVGAFAAGSNSAGELAPSYLATPECGGINPTPFEYLGFPDVHLVMSVTGTLDCAIPEWLDMTPLAGTEPGGESTPVTVTLDGTGLPLGTVAANICIASNDPAKPFVIVPARLSVVEEVIPPVADISPPSLELTIGNITETDTRTLAIGNLGNAESLDWDLLAAAGTGGCYDPAAVPWLTVDALSGSVSPGASQAVAVTASGVLYDNGPLINRPDAGPDGTDLSVLESLTLGMNTLGWVTVDKGGYRVADDLEVVEDWDIHKLTFFVYQTESPPTSTIDHVNYQIWDGPPDDPGSSVVFGDTVTDRLLATGWAGAYRVSEDDPFDTNHPIMSVVAAGGFTLPPGIYWVDAQFGDDGTIVGPPRQPPVAILGETTTGDALHLGANGWEPMLDLNTDAPQGMPFVIHGLPGLSDGIFETSLCIATNDPERPLVVVPVTLIVTGGGEADFASAALDVDGAPLLSDGNGIFEPGERVDVAPAWGNDGASPGFLSGAASDLVGPAGPTYTIVTADADYGAIAPGDSASCLESGLCYEMEIHPPDVPRPATHWEATFDEELSEATTKTWTLHIGDSFTDVLRESLFYASIETLLHHGVTGGCTATEYCPAGANTRAQMAVFLLRAAEGGDYTPPACEVDDERFDDVPASSTFCPWIEELAARGVTSGCGGNSYCPAAAVTRAQMAVFLLRAALGTGYTPPECQSVFTDVPCPSTFADWIEDLANRGVTSGCGATTYCPGDTVTRQQMAVFLSKAFGMTLYGP